MTGAFISINSLSQPFPSRVIFGTSYIDRFAGRKCKVFVVAALLDLAL